MTVNKRWLLEWIDNRRIRTFYLVGEGHYEPIRPHGSEVYAIGEISEVALQKYWKEWIGRTGYLESDLADVCFLYPEDMQIDDFIQAAGTAGIKFAKATGWSIADVVEYIHQSGRKIKNIPTLSQSKTLSFDLVDGQHIFAYCASKKEFLSNVKSTDVDFDGEENSLPNPDEKLQWEHEDASQLILDAEKSPLNQTEDLPQATTQEIRDAMRRVANRQCKTIDYKR